MATVKVADKPTLDNVNTNVNNIDTNVTWIKNNLPSGGGGASPTLAILNTNHVFDNKDITVNDIHNYFTSTINMGTSNYITFQLPYLGDYEIHTTIGTSSFSQTISIDTVGGVCFDALTIGAFSTITDAQISSMLNMHYNNEIDISNYWSVGDTRSISLSSMSSYSGTGETHAAQTQEFVILDFNHDDLVTSINGHSKAAVSIGMKDCLNETGCMSTTANTYFPYTGRYSWLNNNKFYNAIPSSFRSLIKNCAKEYYSGSSGASGPIPTTYSCKTWIPTYTEISGNQILAMGYYIYEGTRYTYYKTTSSRIKKVNGTNNNWWTSSKYTESGGIVYYYCFSATGSVNTSISVTTNYVGISPGFCI